MLKYYILDNKHNVVEEKDHNKWAKWFFRKGTMAHRRVGLTCWGKGYNAIEVSTIFLGLPHNILDDKKPILFETLVFGGNMDGYVERCSTWEGAEVIHKNTCSMIEKETGKKGKEVK